MHEVMEELQATGVLPSTAAPARDTAVERAAAATVSAAPITNRQAVPATEPPPAVAAAAPVPAVPATEPPPAVAAAAPVPAVPIAVRAPEPTLAVAARSQLVEGRVAALDQREQAIRQRERELADQRRVLAEEYRLLRTQRPTPPPAGAPAALRVSVARPTAATRFEPARQESAWGRFKRFLLGLAAPAIEEN